MRIMCLTPSTPNGERVRDDAVLSSAYPVLGSASEVNRCVVLAVPCKRP